MSKNTHRVWALCLVLLPLLSACSKPLPPEAPQVVRPVKVMEVGAGEGDSTRTFPGSVQATDQVDLSFRVGGPLIQFPVKEGDLVRKGQALAHIDPRDFRIQLDAARARARSRAAHTRWRTASDVSPACARRSSCVDTRGTVTCMSNRSSSGPDTRAR